MRLHEEKNPVSAWLYHMGEVALRLPMGFVPTRFCFWEPQIRGLQSQVQAAHDLAQVHRTLRLGLVFVNPMFARTAAEAFRRRGYPDFMLYEDFAAFASAGFDAVVVYSLPSSTRGSVVTGAQLSQAEIRVGDAAEGRSLFRFLARIPVAHGRDMDGSRVVALEEMRKALGESVSVLSWPDGHDPARDLTLMSQWMFTCFR
jgi:hypothetical protein